MAIDSFCKKLKIAHPLDQSTCIGYGQRKPTCGCAVAIASRQTACSLLEDIARSVQQCKVVQDVQLQRVAGLLHCKRWHQYQAPAVAEKWSRIISELSKKNKEELITKRTTRRTVDSTTEQQRPTKIKIIVAWAHDPDSQAEYMGKTTTKLSKLMNKYCREHGLEKDATAFYLRDHLVDDDDTPESIGMRRGDILEVCEYESESESDFESVDDSDFESEFDSDEDTSAQDEHETAPARASHVECCICTENYENDQETWECEKCQNRAHTACFTCWATEQKRRTPAVVSCPYCRARVP